MAPRNQLCSVYWQNREHPEIKTLVDFTSNFDSVDELNSWLDGIREHVISNCPDGYIPLIVYPDV